MDHSAHAGHPAPAIPQGLQVAEQGYRITPPFHTADAGTSRIEFTIVGPDGTPVTDFDERHDKRLHFIAAQRDTSVFHHLHPRMDAAGLWSVEVDLTPGVWRLFADFAPTGADTALTLGADLAVPGDFRPRPLPEPSATSTIDDYTVTLAGDLAAGRGTELRATVTRQIGYVLARSAFISRTSLDRWRDAPTTAGAGTGERCSLPSPVRCPGVAARRSPCRPMPMSPGTPPSMPGTAGSSSNDGHRTCRRSRTPRGGCS